MNRQILVVDDEEQVRDLLTMYFSKGDYTVITASSSTEAIKTLQAQPVDLVLLDIMLGQEDGLWLLRTLKSKHPKVRVVMLTGMGFVEDLVQEAQDKGADGYMSKLLPLEDLQATVERVLERPASGPPPAAESRAH